MQNNGVTTIHYNAVKSLTVIQRADNFLNKATIPCFSIVTILKMNTIFIKPLLLRS